MAFITQRSDDANGTLLPSLSPSLPLSLPLSLSLNSGTRRVVYGDGGDMTK